MSEREGVVHLLKEVEGSRFFRAKCGYEEQLPRAGALPPAFTGWASRVTCDTCVGVTLPERLL